MPTNIGLHRGSSSLTIAIFLRRLLKRNRWIHGFSLHVLNTLTKRTEPLVDLTVLSPGVNWDINNEQTSGVGKMMWWPH